MSLLALLLSATAPAPVPPSPSPIDVDARAVERTTAELGPHARGTWLDGKPRTDRLAMARWQAVQRWAALWLDRHPGADAAALVHAAERFGDEWSFTATSLGRGDMLVSASHSWVGNAFILGRNKTGKHRVRWSTATAQSRLNREADEQLSLWRPAVQNGVCHPVCQMMGGGRVGWLPSAADGTRRFWIQATYAREMGATGGEQLSLWSWRNGRARPLLVHSFPVMIEQGEPVLRGSVLHVPSKGSWNSLYACGSCFGRETDLRFAIGPRRVTALSPVSLTRELDLVDRVFWRVLARRRIGAAATPAALRSIRTQLADNPAETDPELKTMSGMVMGWKRWTANGVRSLCLNVEGVGPMAFAFDRRLTRIVLARPLEPGACQGHGTRA